MENGENVRPVIKKAKKVRAKKKLLRLSRSIIKQNFIDIFRKMPSDVLNQFKVKKKRWL